MGKNIGVFLNKLFESREIANSYHFRKESYNYHKILEDYYKDINELYDGLVEVYQGKYGIIEYEYEIIVNTKKTDDVVLYFVEVAEFVEKNRYIIKEQDTFLQSIVDDILNLLYKTLFKMKYLAK